MRSRNPRSAAHCRRSGLAPLELVLVLPMFMMILALMIIVGTAGSWKVRTLANSRQAVFRAVYPRTTDNDVNPQNWPAPATMFPRGATPSPFDRDPFAGHYVVRGPVISDPNTGRMLYVKDLTLDITRGLESGFAEIDRELPLWSQLPYRNHYLRDSQVFAGEQWQYGTMNRFNDPRRILITYEYDLQRSAPAQYSEMHRALLALMAQNTGDTRLRVLDRDDELRSYYGDPYDPDWDRRYDRFNFHPHVPDGNYACNTVLRPIVDRLVGRPGWAGEIERVPCRMTDAFLAMYYEQRVPGVVDTVLETKITQLEQFRQQLSCP